MLRCIYKYTTTIGVRGTALERFCLDRRIETVNTPYGNVRRKISEGYGIRREKYEYEDLARIANEQGLSIEEVKKLLLS